MREKNKFNKKILRRALLLLAHTRRGRRRLRGGTGPLLLQLRRELFVDHFVLPVSLILGTIKHRCFLIKGTLDIRRLLHRKRVAFCFFIGRRHKGVRFHSLHVLTECACRTRFIVIVVALRALFVCRAVLLRRSLTSLRLRPSGRSLKAPPAPGRHPRSDSEQG